MNLIEYIEDLERKEIIKLFEDAPLKITKYTQDGKEITFDYTEFHYIAEEPFEIETTWISEIIVQNFRIGEIETEERTINMKKIMALFNLLFKYEYKLWSSYLYNKIIDPKKEINQFDSFYEERDKDKEGFDLFWWVFEIIEKDKEISEKLKPYSEIKRFNFGDYYGFICQKTNGRIFLIYGFNTKVRIFLTNERFPIK